MYFSRAVNIITYSRSAKKADRLCYKYKLQLIKNTIPLKINAKTTVRLLQTGSVRPLLSWKGDIATPDCSAVSLYNSS